MNSNARKTGLFLMELIIAILFFSLAAAICIQLFVRSHTLSDRSTALNHSILLAQNTAEIFYAAEGDLTEMSQLLDYDTDLSIRAVSRNIPNTLTLFYTDEFKPAELASDAGYQQTITLTADSDPSLITCHITISALSSGETVYSLDTTLFQRAGTSSAVTKE